MSGYGDLFIKPTIVQDPTTGASTATVTALANNTDTAFDSVSKIIGNFDGETSIQSGTDLFSTSIIGDLGSSLGFSPEKPFNVAFSGYTQTFNNVNIKEFILDLNPNIGLTITITSISDPSITWNRVASRAVLENPGDYVLDGRSLLFFKQPSGQFSIQYSGTYPQNEGGLPDGYLPNVYPSPNLIASQPTTKPVVTSVSGTRYKIDFVQSSENNYLEAFGGNLALEYGPLLSPYVSTTDYNETPLDYVSIWCKAAAGTNYRKLNSTHIYLLSNTEIEFEAPSETFNIANDTFVMVLANITIGDAIKSLNKLMAEHNHDRYGSTTTIQHSALEGLIPVSTKTGVNYGGSVLPGNDHPQYLNREGYNDSDPGTFNNAMLGDLLLGSTDPTSLFNNIIADSNRLVFGSISSGVSIKYSLSNTALLLFATQNGLKIQSEVTSGDGKQSYALSLNGHQLFNYNIGGEAYLDIGSSSSKIRFSDNTGTNLADIYLNKLNCVDQDVSGIINLENQASITIGTIKLAQTIQSGNTGLQVTQTSDSNAQVEFDAPTSFALSNHIIANITTGNVATILNMAINSKLAFDSNNYFQFADITDTVLGQSVTERTLQANLLKPFRLVNTGRRTGLSFGSNISDEYFSLYSASPTGAVSNPSISDTYMETHTGSLYLIQTTSKQLVDGSQIYTWQSGSTDTRIDSLQNWPRSNLFAKDANFNSVTVNPSTLTEKAGINFGNNNSIYVTGPGTNCPTGYMVLESSNGVILVNASSDNLNCSSLNYQDLTAGDIQSYGSIIAKSDVSAGGDIRSSGGIYGATLAIVGDTTLGGDVNLAGTLTLQKDLISLAGATFNTNVQVQGNLGVGNTLTTNLAVFNGTANFNEVSNFNANVFFNTDIFQTGTYTLTGNLNVNGRTTTTTLYGTEGHLDSLIINTLLTVNAPANIAGSLIVGGSATIGQTLIAQTLQSTGTTYAAQLNISGNSEFGGTVQFDDDITLKANVILNSSSSTLTIAGTSQFNGASSFSGTLNAYGQSTFFGGFIANSGVDIKSIMNVDGVANFNSSIEVAYQTTTNSLLVKTTATINQGLNVIGQLEGSNAQFSGDVIISGTLNAGSLVLNGGISTTPTSTSSFGNVTVNGSFSQSSAASMFTVAGPATFANTATFSSVLNSTNIINVGTTHPVVISDNQIAIGPSGSRGGILTGTIQSEGLATLNSLTVNGATTFTNGPVSFNLKTITQVADPVYPNDGANKNYIDVALAALSGPGHYSWIAPVVLGNPNGWTTYTVSTYAPPKAEVAVVQFFCGYIGNDQSSTMLANATGPTDAGSFIVFKAISGGNHTSGVGTGQAILPIVNGQIFLSCSGETSVTVVAFF